MNQKGGPRTRKATKLYALFLGSAQGELAVCAFETLIADERRVADDSVYKLEAFWYDLKEIRTAEVTRVKPVKHREFVSNLSVYLRVQLNAVDLIRIVAAELLEPSYSSVQKNAPTEARVYDPV